MKIKLSDLFLGAGMITVIVTRLHHLVYYPHLTEAQAFLYYWPMWISAILWLVVGCYINHIKGKQDS